MILVQSIYLVVGIYMDLQQELPKAVELMAKAADLVPDGRISAWVTFMMKEGH